MVHGAASGGLMRWLEMTGIALGMLIARAVAGEGSETDDQITQGRMVVADGQGEIDLPLLKTEVDARLAGLLARVTVRQVFVNRNDKPVEVEYLFPLGERAAVDSMEFRTPDRRIRGVVKPKAVAEQEYQAARAAGQRATVLHQIRNNLFRQKITNIMPGDTVEVRLGYLEELDYDLHTLRFHFPMTVGPYYHPQGSSAETQAATGTTYIVPTTRHAAEVSLKVHLLKNAGITLMHSPSHRTRIGESADRRWWEISLGEGDRIPNKDFLLEVPFRNEQAMSQLLVEKVRGESFFQYVLYPPVAPPAQVFDRELVFVVDVSGSMRGYPLDKSKQVMERLLKSLRSTDRFRVVTFAGIAESMSAEPLVASDANVRKALNYVDRQEGGGGTEFMAAIEAIFPARGADAVSSRQRIVLFLTDGYIGNESQIIQSVRDRAMGNRVFTLGVGNSVNHSLLQGMALAGAGVHATLRTDGDEEKAMREFYARIEAPMLTDMRLQGTGFVVAESYPRRIMNLVAGRPLLITGKLSGKGAFALQASARLPDGKMWNDRPEAVVIGNTGLAALWARKKVENIELYEGTFSGDDFYLDSARQTQVEKLGVTYQIMTGYTSFVAVEDKIVNQGGVQTYVPQPAQAPEAVDMQAAGGEMAKSVSNGMVAYAMAAPVSPMGKMELKGEIRDNLGGLLGGMADEGPEGQKTRANVSVPAAQDIKLTPGENVRTAAEIAQVVRARSPGLRHIYNKYLKLHAGMTAKIVLRITIDAQGGVTQCLLVSSDSGIADFDEAVRSAVSRWRWKQIAHGNTTVTLPFTFSE